MQQKTLETSGLKLIALVLVLLSPMLFSSLLYIYRDQVSLKTSNRGHLIEPPVTLDSLGLSNVGFEKKWQIFYVSPKKCDQQCVAQKDLLQRIHMALGKDQSRVLLRSEYKEFFSRASSFKSSFASIKEYLKDGAVWIVDPKGSFILHYTSDFLSAHPQKAKGILEDLRRLLRLSHVR